MYKKIFSAILFGVLTIASTSTFVSCKDYDDDINDLQRQLDEVVNTKIATINTTLTTLNTQVTAIDAAYKEGDKQTLAAAKELIEAAKADLKAAHDKDVKSLQEKDAALDQAIAKANQRIDDIVKLLSDQDGNIQQVGKDLKALSDKLSDFEAKYGTLTTAFGDLTKRVTNLEDAVKAQDAALKALADQIVKGSDSDGYNDTELKNKIDAAGNKIAALEKSIADLDKQVNDKIDAAVKTINDKIDGVNTDLQGLKGEYSAFATQVTNEITTINTNIAGVKAQAEATAASLGTLDQMFKILVDDLRGLVYMPKLYVNGIETIEYPYLKYERLVNQKNLAQTRKEKDDDVVVNLRDLEDYRKLAAPDSVAYGPVWPVQYHMNPGNASTEFASVMGWYVYEGEVLTRAFYDTKNNTASTYGFTPRNNWDNQYKNDNIWEKKNGIMTLGLQITNVEKIDNPGVAAGSNHFPSDLKEDTNDGRSPESVYNVMAALQARSSKSAADYAAAGKDTIITSDYAQILPEKVKIEGMIWNTNPGYWKSQNERIKDFWENKKGYGDGNYASCAALDGGVPYKYRTGDGTAANGRDEEGPRCGKWVHVWDTPEEALLHPADIELYIDQEVVLSKYLGIHWYFEQNEPITKNVADHKNIQTWKFDSEELRRYGFVWVFDTVDYYVDTNKTHDSRYMRFTDHRTGALVSADITEVGATYESTTHTSVGREPLVRVRFYHFSDISNMEKWQSLNTSSEPKKDIDAFNALNAKCVLDGYIRLHITRPEKLEIEYPTESIKFDLCNDASTTKYGRTNYWDYAMFNARVLKNALNEMEKEQFDAQYAVELAAAGPQNPTGENRDVEVAQYIQSGSPIAESPNEYYYYKNVTGVAFNASNWSACQVGHIYTEENVDGVSNHTYWWTISAEELEAMTHHAGSPDAGSTPVTVTRWIHYTGHFYSSTREHSAGAKYDDIFIKLTLTINRDDIGTSETSKKDENYWYKADGSWNGWFDLKSAEGLQSVAINTPYPKDVNDPAVRPTIPWTYELRAAWDQNKIAVSNKTKSKLYIAPFEYKITALDGTVYMVTPKRGSGDNVFDKFICKYWNNNTHAYKLDQTNPFNSAELLKNNEILNSCAIRYEPDAAGIQMAYGMNVTTVANASAWPKTDGVFSNDTLYAYVVSGPDTKRFNSNQHHVQASSREYEPIAIIVNTDPENGGQITLLHEYVENKWLNSQDCYSDNHVGEENEIAEACLNAVGYELTKIGKQTFDGDLELLTGEFEDHGNPIGKQLRAYIGVIATQKCNIANRMNDKEEPKNFTVFQASWERPINILEEADFMVDAINNGDYIYMVDLLKLFDWRGASNVPVRQGAITDTGYMWGDTGIPAHWTVQNWRPNQWLWAYYGVKEITMDLRTSAVQTNLSQTNPATFVPMSSISNMVRLTGNGTPGGKNRNVVSFDLRNPIDYAMHTMNADLISYMGLDNARQEGLDNDKAKFGYIFYENNELNVQDFKIKVPVTVTYDWGVILDQPIVINVHFTRGNTTTPQP